MRWALNVLLVVVVVVVALIAMRHGWQARARRSAALLPALPDVPDDLGAARTGPLEAVYVSTVRASDRLDRVVAHGLGIRSSATVQVFASGVLVDRAGVLLFLDPDHLRQVTTSAGQVGKMMRADDAVVLVEWTPPSPAEEPLATALRMRRAADQEALLAAAGKLLHDPQPAEEEQLIERLQNSVGSAGFEKVADETVEKFESFDDPSVFVGPVIRLIEENPDAELGNPGGLVHFVEKFYEKGYESLLVESLERSPTAHTIWMLNRIINDTSNPARREYVDLMKRIAERDDIDTETKRSAQSFLDEKV